MGEFDRHVGDCLGRLIDSMLCDIQRQLHSTFFGTGGEKEGGGGKGGRGGELS